MNLDPDLQQVVSGSLLRLRSRSPFFAALALFVRFEQTERFRTAATDGRSIFLNRHFAGSLQPAELDGLLLHEVLHAALMHVPRRGPRDPLLWNIAADIVVNGMIAALPAFALPAGALRDKQLESFSVEEVYELLQLEPGRWLVLDWQDLLDSPPADATGEGADLWGERLAAYWRNAREQAAALARSTNAGNLPGNLLREMTALDPAQLDWRSYLWRYLVRTPTDFAGFDRRFVAQGLYLEALEGESCHIFAAVDTSGSIGPAQLQLFLSEVKGILRSYPHIRCDLYYVDAEAHGPYSLDSNDPIPTPRGGGGTDFRPFFTRVEKERSPYTESACVYLTDGYGAFPDSAPSLPVLWVVAPGGLESEKFPFGETVRLVGGG